MVELVRLHGADHQQVIGHRPKVREVIAELHPTLAVRLEDPLGAHQLDGVRLDEGETCLVQHLLGQGLAVALVQFRLGVEQVQV